MRTMIPVRGSECIAGVHKSTHAPGWWSYVLYDGEGKMIGSDAIDFTGTVVTPDQVARVAFLLEVEYGLNAVSDRYGR